MKTQIKHENRKLNYNFRAKLTALVKRIFSTNIANFLYFCNTLKIKVYVR